VYFGLRDDPDLAAELHGKPLRGWRAIAVAASLLGAGVVGLAIAAGVLALAGVHRAWPLFVQSVALVATVISLSQAYGRLRERRRDD
jgi:hypothetical protein